MGAPDLPAAAESVRSMCDAATTARVTMDPAEVPAIVAQDGVAVYIGLLADLEPATLARYVATFPVHVACSSPFGPAQADTVYRVLGDLVHALDVTGYRTNALDLGEVQLPALTLDARIHTSC